MINIESRKLPLYFTRMKERSCHSLSHERLIKSDIADLLSLKKNQADLLYKGYTGPFKVLLRIILNQKGIGFVFDVHNIRYFCMLINVQLSDPGGIFETFVDSDDLEPL